MQNKSTGNGGKGRKRPVKKQDHSLDEQIRRKLEEARKNLDEAKKINMDAWDKLNKWAKEKMEALNASSPCKHCLFRNECKSYLKDTNKGEMYLLANCAWYSVSQVIKAETKTSGAYIYVNRSLLNISEARRN